MFVLIVFLIGFYCNMQKKLTWLNDDINLKRLKRLLMYKEKKEAEEEANALKGDTIGTDELDTAAEFGKSEILQEK